MILIVSETEKKINKKKLNENNNVDHDITKD